MVTEQPYHFYDYNFDMGRRNSEFDLIQYKGETRRYVMRKDSRYSPFTAPGLRWEGLRHDYRPHRVTISGRTRKVSQSTSL